MDTFRCYLSDQSRSRSEGNKKELHISQNSSFTGASTSCCLLSYQDTRWGVFHLCRYAISILYSPADWAKCVFSAIFNLIAICGIKNKITSIYHQYYQGWPTVRCLLTLISLAIRPYCTLYFVRPLDDIHLQQRINKFKFLFICPDGCVYRFCVRPNFPSSIHRVFFCLTWFIYEMGVSDHTDTVSFGAASRNVQNNQQHLCVILIWLFVQAFR